MGNAFRSLILVALLAGGVLLPGHPAAAGAVAAAAVPEIDLSDQAEWCASDPASDVAAISAGGCRFVAADRGAMARGFSRQAYWLRLTLVNPEDGDITRWLRIGHPRLGHVTFFESGPSFESSQGGHWRRSDSGMEIPPVARPVFSADAVLPLVLKPHESRTVLVRVVSKTSLDLTPTLWQPNAYLSRHSHTDILYAFSTGTLLVTSLFTLIVFLQWREPAYLYFSAGELAKAVFVGGYGGLLPTYLWPADQPFDIGVLAAAAGFSVILFVLFVRRFVGSLDRHRILHTVLAVLAVVMVPLTGWTCLVDYSDGIRVVMLIVFAVLGVATLLFWRCWRDGFGPAGHLLAAYALFLAFHLYAIVFTFGGDRFSDMASLGYLLGFLLSAPISLSGITLHRQQLQTQLQAARADSATRVAFLAQMSHELRTPLDTILGNVQLLSRTPGRLRVAEPPLAERLTDIRESGLHLLKMIDDILDHARGSADKLTLTVEPVDWLPFLRGLVHNARLLADRNGSTVELKTSGDMPAGLWVDEQRLRQILDNLLVNAARHTRNGWIRLDCRVGSADAEGMRPVDFAVVDNGEGIAPADQERIFQPFERGRRDSRHNAKGAGMGLAISRQLVELMGGRLTVESRLGDGACFRFRIMARGDDAPALPARPTTLAGTGYEGPQRTILLVDDADGNRRILAAMLRSSGFRVIEARSGRDALAGFAAEAAVDLVLTDQFMADGDGWALLDHLTARQPDLPVVLISAAPPQRPAAQCPTERRGAAIFTAHLLKPLDHARLLVLIGDLLGLDCTQSQTVIDAGGEPPIGVRPGAAELDSLRRMIDGGQISGIMAWSQALQDRDRRYLGYAEAVIAAARQLDIAALNRLAADTPADNLA